MENFHFWKELGCTGVTISGHPPAKLKLGIDSTRRGEFNHTSLIPGRGLELRQYSGKVAVLNLNLGVSVWLCFVIETEREWIELS